MTLFLSLTPPCPCWFLGPQLFSDREGLAPHRGMEGWRRTGHKVLPGPVTSSFVTLDKLLKLSEPPFSHLESGTVFWGSCLTGTLVGVEPPTLARHLLFLTTVPEHGALITSIAHVMREE